MAKRIKAEHFGAAIKAKTDQIVEIVKGASYNAALFGERHAVQLTNERGLVNYGTYKLAWRRGASRKPYGAQIKNNTPYAPVLEYGRRPGAPGPPLAPILDWVESKLVRNGDVEPGDAWWVAERIRAHIHRHGSPPRGVLFDTTKAMKKHFREEAMKRLRRKFRAAK